MEKYCKKVAICYNETSKTVVKNGHVTKVTNAKAELYFLESIEESKKYKKKPLFK